MQLDWMNWDSSKMTLIVGVNYYLLLFMHDCEVNVVFEIIIKNVQIFLDLFNVHLKKKNNPIYSLFSTFFSLSLNQVCIYLYRCQWFWPACKKDRQTTTCQLTRPVRLHCSQKLNCHFNWNNDKKATKTTHE